MISLTGFSTTSDLTKNSDIACTIDVDVGDVMAIVDLQTIISFESNYGIEWRGKATRTNEQPLEDIVYRKNNEELSIFYTTNIKSDNLTAKVNQRTPRDSLTSLWA